MSDETIDLGGGRMLTRRSPPLPTEENLGRARQRLEDLLDANKELLEKIRALATEEATILAHLGRVEERHVPFNIAASLERYEAARNERRWDEEKLRRGGMAKVRP